MMEAGPWGACLATALALTASKGCSGCLHVGQAHTKRQTTELQGHSQHWRMEVANARALGQFMTHEKSNLFLQHVPCSWSNDSMLSPQVALHSIYSPICIQGATF